MDARHKGGIQPSRSDWVQELIDQQREFHRREWSAIWRESEQREFDWHELERQQYESELREGPPVSRW